MNAMLLYKGRLSWWRRLRAGLRAFRDPDLEVWDTWECARDLHRPQTCRDCREAW